MKKIHHLLIAIFVLCAVKHTAQGIINNGGRIVLNGAANIYVDGGAAGDYLSQAGGLISPSATGVIRLEGDWTNNSANTGFGSDNGTVILVGANQQIGGSSSTTFYNLTLQGSGIKTQAINTNVGGVTTTNGVLSVGNVVYNLNSFTLTITNPLATAVTYGTGFIQSETAAAFNPSVMRWSMGTSTGAHIFPFGTSATQLPLTFNKTSAASSSISIATRATAGGNNLPWSNPVTHMFSPVIGGDGSIPVVIDRWWDIFATTTTNANITFTYRGAENTLSAPYNIGNLGAQNWNAAWLPPVGSAIATLAGTGNVTASGLTITGGSAATSPWVLSSLTAPLPIELSEFKVNCSEEDAVIDWTTSSEKNASHFNILNSYDGIDYKKVGSINAKGKAHGNTRYNYLLKGKKTYGNYYRLQMVDKDKTDKQSDTRYLDDNCVHGSGVQQIFYNSETGLVLSISSMTGQFELNLYDVSGKTIFSESFNQSTSYSEIIFRPQLNPGMYIASVKSPDGTILSKKIMIAR